jgi:D-beta-D-heptose 7-phosphate kinase/D-beta-D-heptose 1-phosphate adenosyltransferase
VLAGLGFVDYVTGFEEDTADKLIEQLRPTIYAKGTEYSLKTLPERETLKRLDVKAVFVGDKKAHSSSKLIQKIKKRKFA